MVYAGSEWFRATCFEEPTPPAWGEDEVQGAAKGFSCEGDGLAYGGWTFWLTPFYLDIG